MVAPNIVEVCQEYARLLCAWRTTVMNPVDFLRADTMLFEMAPKEALPYLDTIKRIMEIDWEVTDPITVLLRASVIIENGEIE